MAYKGALRAGAEATVRLPGALQGLSHLGQPFTPPAVALASKKKKKKKKSPNHKTRNREALKFKLF